MNNRGDLNINDKIISTVQKALNTTDFNKLNTEIQNITRDALDEARKAIGMKTIASSDNKKLDLKNKNHSINHDILENNSDTLNKTQLINKTNKNKKVQTNKKYKEKLIKSGYTVPVGKLSGFLMSVFGVAGTVVFGIAIYAMALLGNLMGSLFNTIGIFLIPLLFLSIGLAIKGNSVSKRLKRFQLYVSCLGDRNYCLIDDLSSASGLENKYIVKDLRKMIQSGMFPEGHIDNKNTTFILTDETFKQYQAVQYLEREKSNAADKNIEGEKAKQIEPGSEAYPGLNDEVRKTLSSGRKLVAEIKEANIAIPGEEISRKLDRLEEVTEKIFNYVEIHPETCNEIKKFTDYFLPTTLKLLDAYKRLDDQPVQGQNISNAKKEIEKTMDTINIAFENLLDDLFQNMAMDISTDISVLETMFVQEGLTQDDMRAKNKREEDKNE